jgi:DNA-binding CsgD family transcriptional regulator
MMIRWAMTVPVGMSAREAEVLDALGAHLSDAQIAGRLHISVRTVESHVASLLRRLGAADRRELAGLGLTVLLSSRGVVEEDAEGIART